MSTRVEKNLPFLRELDENKSWSARERILDRATNDELFTFIDICINILDLRFPLTAKERRRLRKYASYIRDIAKRKSTKYTKEMLQVGGNPFISALLGPVLAAVTQHLLTANNG